MRASVTLSKASYKYILYSHNFYSYFFARYMSIKESVN